MSGRGNTMSYVVRCYDPYDGLTFDYHVFGDKASAKSYARHCRSPYNVGVSCWETSIKAPTVERIDSKNALFDAFEKDGYYLD